MVDTFVNAALWVPCSSLRPETFEKQWKENLYFILVMVICLKSLKFRFQIFMYFWNMINCNITNAVNNWTKLSLSVITWSFNQVPGLRVVKSSSVSKILPSLLGNPCKSVNHREINTVNNWPYGIIIIVGFCYSVEPRKMHSIFLTTKSWIIELNLVRCH